MHLQQPRPGLVPQLPPQRNRIHKVRERQRQQPSAVLALELLGSRAMLRCKVEVQGVIEVSRVDFDRQQIIRSEQALHAARPALFYRPEVAIQPCQGFFDLLSSGNIMAGVINPVAFIFIRSSKKTEHGKL